MIVIGAGPAGSTAARVVAARGHRVLLVDRREFPRDKVCGDALIPDAIAALRRAGLLDTVGQRAHVADTLSVFSPSNVRVDLPGRFMTIRRMDLDAILKDAATEAGVDFRTRRVVAIESVPGEGATVRFADGSEECATVAVLATGADTTLRSAPANPGETEAVALRGYVRSSFDIPELVVSFSRRILPGYAWIFPLGAGWYNVGCGAFRNRGRRKVNLERLFDAFVTTFPLARRLLDGASERTRVRGARLRCGLSPDAAYDGGAVIAVGETIATTYPFTGEGIGKAMESAELAADAIHEALVAPPLHTRLAQIPDRLRQHLAPRYDGYRVAERWIAHAWLTDLVAQRVSRSEDLRRASAEILNETAGPKTLFSWRLVLLGRRNVMRRRM